MLLDEYKKLGQLKTKHIISVKNPLKEACYVLIVVLKTKFVKTYLQIFAS